jgi:hypothetical protein
VAGGFGIGRSPSLFFQTGIVICVAPVVHAAVEMNNGEGDSLRNGELGDLVGKAGITNGAKRRRLDQKAERKDNKRSQNNTTIGALHE